MPFIDSPTERTTAVTDVMLAILALGCAFYLWSLRLYDPWKVNLWSAAFCLLALAATLGAIAHGFKMSDKTNQALWQPLNFALGLIIALFVGGVVYDVWGLAVAQILLPIMVIVGLLFFSLTRLIPGTFFVFVVYQAIAMLFALGAYSWLVITGQLAGAIWMATGVLVTMIASGVQADESLSARFIWQFDHNGLYHLIQMVGVAALVIGLQLALSA